MITPSLNRFTEFGRKIVGVGFNFRGLIKQMQVGEAAEPRLYLKDPSSYIRQGQKIQIPSWSKESLWYEVELGVVIEKPIYNASVEEVEDSIGGYVTALDMTDKGCLLHAKSTGLSWAVSKSFPTACPVGEFIPRHAIDNLSDLTLWLTLNGEKRQEGHTSTMTWSPLQLISSISRYMKLERGDMILTGTPEGMGAVSPGDVVEAGIKGIDIIKFEVNE